MTLQDGQALSTGTLPGTLQEYRAQRVAVRFAGRRKGQTRDYKSRRLALVGTLNGQRLEKNLWKTGDKHVWGDLLNGFK